MRTKSRVNSYAIIFTSYSLTQHLWRTIRHAIPVEAMERSVALTQHLWRTIRHAIPVEATCEGLLDMPYLLRPWRYPRMAPTPHWPCHNCDLEPRQSPRGCLYPGTSPGDTAPLASLPSVGKHCCTVYTFLDQLAFQNNINYMLLKKRFDISTVICPRAVVLARGLLLR